MKSDDLDNASTPYLKARVRAPILWIVLPLIFGYVVARTVSGFPLLLLIIPGILLGVAWMIAWWTRRYRLLYWRLVGVLCIFFLSWAYLLLQLSPSLDWRGKPQREVDLTIKVKQVRILEDKYHRQAGYAEIVKTPKHLEDLAGQKISFLLFPRDVVPEDLVRSQVIQVRGVLSSILPGSGNSYEDYLSSQGISFRLDRGQILETESAPLKFFKFCKKQNEYLESILSQGGKGGDDNAMKIYNAMLLGSQASLTADQKYAYQVTGSLHLFSISGLHVAMIAACIAYFLRVIKVPRALEAIIGLVALFLYVEITGGAPSAMRAFLMVAFYWGARALRRKKGAFSALGASALIALIINPFDLWNIGFQLSYGVVGCILLYGVPLNEVANRWIDDSFGKFNYARFLVRWVLNLIGISLAANIGSAFLSILYFKTFAPGAVLLSVIIIPLASLVIVIGCISLLLGLIGLSLLSGLINPVSWLIIKVMGAAISLSLKIPGLFWESFAIPSILIYTSLGIVFIALYLGHVFNKLGRPGFYTFPIAIILLLVGLGRFIG